MSPRSLLASLVLASIVFSGCTSGDGPDGGGATITPKMTITGLDSARDNFKFDAAGTTSTNPIAKYAWNFGDGETKEGNPVEKKFERIDTAFNVSLVVTDTKGNKGAIFQELQVGSYANQAPGMGIKEAPRWVKPGTALSFDSGSSEDHDNDPLARTWIFGAYPPDAVTFDTGYMSMGNSTSMTFDKTGVYFLHCHPHPWMKFRVAVDPAASAPDNSTITIANFGYGMDNLSVPPGTALTFTNEDPLPHTATLEKYVAGTIVGTGKTVSIPAPPEGKYQIWVFGDDRKGGVGYQAYGVQVGADAPTFAFTSVNSGPLAQAGVVSKSHVMAAFAHNASVSATLTFNAVQSATVKLDMVRDGSTTAVLTNSGSASGFKVEGNALKDNYDWIVSVTNGAISESTLSVTVTYLADPGFGAESSAGAGGGGHHH